MMNSAAVILERKAEDLTPTPQQGRIRRAVSDHRRTISSAAGRAWRRIDSGLSDENLRSRIARGGRAPGDEKRFFDAYADAAGDDMRGVWTDSQGRGSAPIRAEALNLRIELDEGRLDAAAVAWSDSRANQWARTLARSQARTIDAVIGASTELPEGDRVRLLRLSVGLTPSEGRSLVRSRLELLASNPEASDATIDRTIRRLAAQKKRTRRERIARLEVGEAFNRGALTAAEAIEASGQTAGVYAVWQTQPDERTCPICRPLDGNRIRIGSVFVGDTVGSETLAQPPAHPGCRCVIVFETGQ